jgi:1,4-dihydroxy-2-naphthoate polyprenyltransferase
MKAWLQAFRLRTLPLALSSIIVGSALAYQHAHLGEHLLVPMFKPIVMLLTVTTAVLLQILSNLANDLGDHQHGTDNMDRVGPQRAVQSGVISPTAMKRGMIISGVLAFTCGLALITVALGVTMRTLAFLLLGLLAIGAAVKYTFGKNPYGYAGLGDISVLLFFGIVGVIGTYYLQQRWLLIELILPALAFGLLSTGVLNTNNMRDIVNDGASGKRTMVVRMGRVPAKFYHGILVLSGYGCLVLYTLSYMRTPWQWLFLVTLPVLVLHLKAVITNAEPRELDPELKRLALFTFFTALTFSLGLILA